MTETCLTNLDKCKAMCCKSMRFLLPTKRKYRRGDLLVLNQKGLTKDLAEYYRLHGCEVQGENIKIRLVNFEQDATSIMIYKRCAWLNDKLQCEHHENKPDVCKRFGTETTEGYFIHEHCIYGGKDGRTDNQGTERKDRRPAGEDDKARSEQQEEPE